MNVYLTTAQAQQIVYQLQEIPLGEISVTDESGYILASSDTRKLHKHSQLAILCVECATQGRTYNERVTKGTETATPLLFRDQCVGTILINGNSEKIKRLTSIAKAVGENIIYTPYIKDTEHVWDVINFEFLTEWLNTPGEYSLSFVRRGIQQGIDVNKPHCAVIMEGIFNILSAQKAVESILTQSNYYVCLGNRTLVLILVENYDAQMLQQICEHFNDIKFAIGKSERSLYESFVSAQNTLFAGKNLHPDKNVYFYGDYELEYALSSIKMLDFDDGVIELFNSPSYEDLRQTLEVFIDVGGNQSEAINRLYIHRNTMKYRLDKIQELTSKNPRLFHDLFYLYVAYVVHRFKYSYEEKKMKMEEKSYEEDTCTDSQLRNDA